MNKFKLTRALHDETISKPVFIAAAVKAGIKSKFLHYCIVEGDYVVTVRNIVTGEETKEHFTGTNLAIDKYNSVII